MSTPVTNPAKAERIRRLILQKADHIPALPELVVRILALLGDRATEPEDLADCLQYDPVLVGKMLALVNSPFYGITREVSTIKDAIMVLGFRGLRSLILASSTAEYLERDYTVFGHNHKGLWGHSLAVASAARELAKTGGLDLETREELFVAGLLHDIGKMFIAPLLDDVDYDPKNDNGPMIDAEHRLLGIDHAEASALVAAKWNLSSMTQETLRHHHDPDEPEEMHKHLAVIRLADALAHDMGIGYEANRCPESILRASDRMALGLNDVQWLEARENIEQVIANCVEQMGSLGN